MKYRILHVDDSPNAIARGIAIGTFTAFLPFYGFHILISILLAAATKSNKAMAAMFVWISNPLTALFIYYPCYKLGHIFLKLFKYDHTLSPEQMDTMLDIFSLHVVLTQSFTVDFWKQVGTVFMLIGLETFIGGLIIGAFAAKVGHWLSLRTLQQYHDKRQKRREQLNQ